MRKTAIMLSAVATLLLLTATSCTSNTATTTTTNTPTNTAPDNTQDTTPTPSPTAPATETTTVILKNVLFVPASIEINAGDTVTFTNEDSMIHTVDVKSLDFESGDLEKGDSTSITFDKTGSYLVTCKYHPAQQATVIVK